MRKNILYNPIYRDEEKEMDIGIPSNLFINDIDDNFITTLSNSYIEEDEAYIPLEAYSKKSIESIPESLMSFQINKESTKEKETYTKPNPKRDLFLSEYDKVKHSSSKKRRELFSLIANKESEYDSYIQNRLGAPAYGYYQLMDFNIPDGDIEEFRSNPEMQIKLGHKLADSFVKQFSKKDYDKARAMGYSESAMIAGAWLGGKGGLNKFLHKNINVSDKHWDKKDGKAGIDMKTQMDRYNNLFKDGGKIDGDKERDAFIHDWLLERKEKIGLNQDLISNDFDTWFNTHKDLGEKAFSEQIKRLSETKEYGNGFGEEDVEKGKIIKEHLSTNKKDGEVIEGTYFKDSNFIHYRDGSKNKNSTVIHERTHALDAWQQEDAIDKYKEGTIFDPIKFLKYKEEYDPDYLDSKEEIYARLMQFRFNNKLNPKKSYTNKDIDNMRSNINITNENILFRYKKPFLLHLLNDIASHNNKNNNNNKI